MCIYNNQNIDLQNTTYYIKANGMELLNRMI